MTGTSFKAILFDKDGTLFDFTRTWSSCTHSALNRIAETPEQFQILCAAIGYNPILAEFARDSIVIAHSSEEVAQAIAAHVDHLSPFDILQIIDAEAGRTVQFPVLPLGPYLDDLRAKGYALGVATNDIEANARTHLASVQVLEKFDFVAGADSGHGFKPEPGQLLAFAKATGTAPSECVMVGDSNHDLHAGKSAGFTTVGVLTGAATAQDLDALADVVLPDIGHLPNWLSQKP